VIRRSVARTLQAFACVLGLASASPAQTFRIDLREPAAIETVFQAGLRAIEAGDARQAILQFSAILAQNPTLTRVRLELGRAYFQAGEFGRARTEFLTVLSDDLPAPVRQSVLQFIREIDARRGFEWSAEVGLAEVGETRRFDTDTLDLDFGAGALPFTLDRDTTQRPGLTYALEATFRAPRGPLAPENALGSAFATVSVTGEDAPGRDLDDMRIGARLGVLRVDPLATFGLALESTARFEQGRHTETRVGLALQGERRFERGQTLFATLRGAQIDHQRSDLLDGTILTAQIGYQRPFSSRGSAGVELLAERLNVDSDLDNTRRYGLRLFGQLDVRGGVTLLPSLLLEQRDFLSPSPLFTDDPDEQSIEFALRIEKNDVFLPGGFSPFLSLQTRRTKAGIDAFSYRRSAVAIGLESRF
jgi:hypothetical protein